MLLVFVSRFFYVYCIYNFIYFRDDLEESTYKKYDMEFRESQIDFR